MSATAPRPCGPNPKSSPDVASQARWGRSFSADEHRCRLERRWQHLPSSFRSRKVTVYTRGRRSRLKTRPLGSSVAACFRPDERAPHAKAHTHRRGRSGSPEPPARTNRMPWSGPDLGGEVVVEHRGAGWEISLCYLRKSRQAGKVPSRRPGVDRWAGYEVRRGQASWVIPVATSRRGGGLMRRKLSDQIT